MTRRNLIAWTAAHVLALAVAGLAPSAHAQPAPEVVQTSAGQVKGLTADGVRKFLGVPFASPPVGDLRWRPPVAPASLTSVRDATKFAPHCAQLNRGVFAAPSNTEDCLYLNVFTPALSGAKRPVMVWFYGGGLFSGESEDYDGGKLASRGDVIVVTLNYRVGALGFLSHPALNQEGHAAVNYGIMDQQFALRWVKDNIAAFGGDPDNVTIFGQSGGGTAVMANLQSPMSRGLFHKAINQSGTRVTVTKPETMVKIGEDFATSAGCAEQSAKCLRALTTEQVLANQGGVLRVVADFPSVDGQVITKPAYEAFESGAYNQVPIFTGLVQDEQSFFMPELATKKALTAEEYEKYAETFGATHKAQLLERYPLKNYESPTLAEIDMAQRSKACTARMLNRAWTKHAPVYSYEFRERTAPSYFPATSYPMRAYHTAELQYLFPMFKGGQGTAQPLNADQAKLSDRMVDYWTSFAKGGAPSADFSRFDPTKDNVSILDLNPLKDEAGHGKSNHCEMWDAILNYR